MLFFFKFEIILNYLLIKKKVLTCPQSFLNNKNGILASEAITRGHFSTVTPLSTKIAFLSTNLS